MDKWDMANKHTEKKRYPDTQNATRNNLTVSNTYFIHKNNDINKLARWHNYDAAVKRKLDYFTISNVNENWVDITPGQGYATYVSYLPCLGFRKWNLPRENDPINDTLRKPAKNIKLPPGNSTFLTYFL